MKDLEKRIKEKIALVNKAIFYGLSSDNLMQFKMYENGFVTYSYESLKYYYEIKIKTKRKLTLIETLKDILHFTDSEISYCKFSVIFKSKEIDSFTFDENN